MGRQATLFCALSLSTVYTTGKPQTFYEATSTTLDNMIPATTYLISAKTKGLPTACDVYCPARAVCERCWRGRCDYEGQEQLCFGCAESSCYNERILQNANYREAKQKSTNAAIAMAAAAAMTQDYNLEGQAYDSNRTKNSRGAGNKNKALLIIQNDRASRVSVSEDNSDFHPSKGGNVKAKKNNASLLSVTPTVLTFAPQPEKRRAGHIPDTTPQLSAIVDQRVWVPVTPYGIVEDYKSRQMRQFFYDEEALGQRTRLLPPRFPNAQTATTEATTTTTTTTAAAAVAPLGVPNHQDDSASPSALTTTPSANLLKPLIKRARSASAALEAAIESVLPEIEPPAKTIEEVVEAEEKLDAQDATAPSTADAVAVAEAVSEEAPRLEVIAGDADAYRPNEELIGSEIEEPAAVVPIAIATLVESLPQQSTPRLVGGFRRNGGLVASFLRPTSSSA